MEMSENEEEICCELFDLQKWIPGFSMALRGTRGCIQVIPDLKHRDRSTRSIKNLRSIRKTARQSPRRISKIPGKRQYPPGFTNGKSSLKNTADDALVEIQADDQRREYRRIYVYLCINEFTKTLVKLGVTWNVSLLRYTVSSVPLSDSWIIPKVVHLIYVSSVCTWKTISPLSSDDAKRTSLCFRETLIICMKNEFATDTKAVGGYCILVEPIGPDGRELLVHVQSSMSIDGHFGGSKVISSATEKFHCLEEKRTEFVYKDNGLHEKTIFIGVEDDFYHVKVTRVCPCVELTDSKDLSFCCNSKFISEGANVLLMRYLALVNYEGTLSLESMNIDGDVTTCIYNCAGAQRMELDGHYLSIYTIERKMHRQDGTLQDIKTYLTPQGRIIRHDWMDVPYVLKINPLTDPSDTSKTATIESSMRERWSEDIEMLSKYLDMKSTKMAEQIEYLSDHPEIKHLIADYVQTLLVGNQPLNGTNFVPLLLRKVTLTLKPVNALDFTIQHFKAFAREPKAFEACIPEDTDDDYLRSQLCQDKTEVICSVCGFCMECNESETRSGEQSLETTDFSICSKYSSEIKCVSERSQRSTSKSETSTDEEQKNHECHLLWKLQRDCKNCRALEGTCQSHQPCPQCPGCLRIFSVYYICTKCSQSNNSKRAKND